MNWLRRSSSVFSLLAVLALPVVPAAARAETIDDAGAWLGFFARGNLDCETSDCLRWWFDGHARFFDDSGGFGQSIIRPGVGYALTESTVAWIGYGWIRTSPDPTPDFDESRVWQQLTWSKSFEPVTIGARSRLEQRFLETGSNTGWRFRQLLSARQKLECAPRYTLVAWDELFVHLNDTDWGADSGFDQNRIFLGIGWKPCPESCWRVEVGYLNQFVDNFGRDDVSNHLVSVNFYWSP